MGNGVSFSPSRMAAAARFASPPPLLSIADNVRAQRALLQSLGVGCDADEPLAMVYGYSMGALQGEHAARLSSSRPHATRVGPRPLRPRVTSV